MGAVGKPNFGSHFRVFTEDDGSKRLVGTSFDEDLRQGNLTFFEYNEQMELLYRTTAELPVRQPILRQTDRPPHRINADPTNDTAGNSMLW